MIPFDWSNLPGDSADDFTTRLLTALSALPPEQQQEAIYQIIGEALKLMPVETIRELREESLREFADHATNPVVSNAIEMIDGHLALREIMSQEGGEEDDPSI